MKETKIQKRTLYDSLSVTVTYPTGGKIKYKINRSGETIEVAFSNDPIELKKQSIEIQTWIGNLPNDTLQHRIDTVAEFFGKFSSGKEAMEALRTDAKIKMIDLLNKANSLH